MISSKKIFAAGLMLMLAIVSTQPIYAASNFPGSQTVFTEYYANGDYIETVLYDLPDNSIQLFSTTKTGSKKLSYKNSGTVLWSVTIKGTFSYDGSTSKCTSCSVSATSNSSDWIIYSKSASKSGNSATGKATAHKLSFGVYERSVTKSVTLSCKPDGTLY